MKATIEVTRAPGAMAAAESAETIADCDARILNMQLLVQEMTGEIGELQDAIEVLKTRRLRFELATKPAAPAAQPTLTFDEDL